MSRKWHFTDVEEVCRISGSAFQAPRPREAFRHRYPVTRIAAKLDYLNNLGQNVKATASCARNWLGKVGDLMCQVEIAEDPRLSGLAPMDAAAHVPLLAP